MFKWSLKKRGGRKKRYKSRMDKRKNNRGKMRENKEKCATGNVHGHKS